MSDKKEAEDTKKILEQINDLKSKSLETTEKNLKTLRETRKQYEEMGGGIERNYIASLAKEEQYLIKRQERLVLEEQIKDRIAKMTAEEAGSEELKAQYQSMSVDQLAQLATTHSNIAGMLGDQLVLRKQLSAEEETSEKHMRSFNAEMDKATNRMSELGKASVFFSFNLNKMASDFKKGIKDGTAEANLNAFADQFLSISNLMFSTSMLIIKTTKDLVLAADQATATFAAATGLGGSYNEVIIDAQRNTNLFAVSMEDTAKSTQALIARTSDFTQLSKSMKTGLVENSALLNKVGVSAETSAMMFQTLTEALHVSDEVAKGYTTSIALMGTEIGISAEQMTKDFSDSMGTLAVYGPRAITVFKNISAAAKAAGVEAQSLMSLASRFDTFKDSATNVAALNAILGTTLSTTQMLMMEEDQRIETVISSIQAQGRAFSDYDRFTKKAIATQLGFKDVAEAEMVLGMDLGQYEQYKSRMKENEDNQKKLKEVVEEAIPLATQLTAIFNEFGVLIAPILEQARDFLGEIREVLDGIPTPVKETAAKFILFGGAVSMAVKFFGPMVAMSSKLLAVFTGGAAAGVGGGAAGGGLVAALTAFSVGLVAAAKPLLIIGAAIGAVYLAAKAIGSIGDSMEFSHVQQAADDMERLEATSVKAASVLENITMLKAGRAANQITGMSMEASSANLTTTLETLFPDTLTLVLNDRTKLETYIADVASEVYKRGRFLPKGT